MSAEERLRPPFDGDERAQLVGWLDLQRAIVRWKCAGLSDEDAHRAVLPTSPLMTMAGIVAHLRWTEHCWFDTLFLGGDESVNPQFGEDVEDADMRTDGQPLADLLEAYERQCERSNEIIAGYPLDTPGRTEKYRSGTASLRWMLTHMIEETARHAGHADIIRELVDGSKGYY
jgi:uncharacterized damage-inducible protein DinB